ncbi:hypothetical protein TIFTF001_017488 [Ficus carica]|uniref:Uncharacterized protein n=1 Tax=Ficus carica TaxID=3494 RepID=A0AA88AQU3_FICCA|nr:hypothetical protein TIFTF001_017488 [Ficus carica]
MGDALWFEVGEDLGKFSINELCLITDMKYVESTYLALAVDNRLMSRYFSTLRAMSREHLEIDPKYFALTDNLKEFNAFPWACYHGRQPELLIRTTPSCDETRNLRSLQDCLYNLNDNVEGNPTTAYHVSYRHKRNFQNDDSDAMMTFDLALKMMASLTLTSVSLRIKEDKDEEENEEKEVEEDEDDKGENDDEKDKEYEEEGEEGEVKENNEKKYENGKGKEEEKKVETTKEKKEEKNDEEAKGEEEERNDEEATMKQDKDKRKNEEAVKEQEKNINDQVVTQIPKQKMSKLSRLRKKRSRPVIESGSAAHALTKMVKVYVLLRGLSDKPPKENLE